MEKTNISFAMKALSILTLTPKQLQSIKGGLGTSQGDIDGAADGYDADYDD